MNEVSQLPVDTVLVPSIQVIPPTGEATGTPAPVVQTQADVEGEDERPTLN